MKYTLANFITSLRIVGTFILLFTVPFSAIFYVVYTLAGISDALDGFIARKTKTSSEFGARLDSIADLLFYTVMLIKILPFLIKTLPNKIWIVVAGILILRFICYVVAALKYKLFASVHTYMNKLTGATLFFVPYFVKLPFFFTYCVIICFISGFASFEETVIHIKSKSYSTKIKTIMKKSV